MTLRLAVRPSVLFVAYLSVLGAAPGWGCVADLECATFSPCDGPGQCVGGDCVYPNPPNCNDSNACTVDGCSNNRGGCFHDPFCPGDTSVCNGVETCSLVFISINPPIRIAQCGHSNVPTCNDQKACTVDFCREPNGCSHTAVNCDDGNLCTVDACGEPGGCTHALRDCDDGDPCTADDCLPGNGCRHQAITPCCESAADCPDLPCAVERQCVANGCTAGVGRGCDDGNPATVDSCDPSRGGCVHLPLPDDGGAHRCAEAGDCPAPADPCALAMCADGRCGEQSLGGLGGLTCTCSRPAPAVCGGQGPPPQVARATKRACRMVGRVANADAVRAGKLLHRVGKHFGRAQRAALASTSRKSSTLTIDCAQALSAVYADGVARARQLEEQQ